MWDGDTVKFCSPDRPGELASTLYDHRVYCFLQIRRIRVYGRSKEEASCTEFHANIFKNTPCI